ncbi:MAG TPA: hypothetical protein EYQ44_02365, partial [Porticoccaceae bacterium]|nr:hypothetical protein [Porticoccaceae bacterium]
MRELANSADIKVLSFSPSKVLSGAETKDNLELKSRDRIVVLSAYGDRVGELAPYVAKLKRQATLGRLPKVVTARGTVRFPGEFPMVEGMSVGGLIEIAGGLLDSAYSQSAEISRIDLSNPNRAVSAIVLFSLNDGSVTKLEPSDYVEFRTIPDFRETQTISLEGEFVFPGVYAFDKSEMLSSVIQRAGGFTDEAFINGSIFLRESLRKREQKELDRLTKVLNDEISADRLKDVNSDIAVDDAQQVLQREAVAKLASAEAQGRLVIPLAEIVNYSTEDIFLKANDRLLIPKFSQEVTVIGEVQRPTSFL